MTEFVLENKAILLSILALLISLRSFSISRRSLVLSESIALENKRVKASEKRAEILELIDRKNAKIGNLQSIYGEKYYYLVQNLQVGNKFPEEIDRIRNNLNSLQNLRTQYNEERKNVELFDEKMDIPFNKNTLAEIKRLLIHIEEDIVKEERGLMSLRNETSVTSQ